MTTVSRLLVFVLGLLAAPGTPLLAHEEGVIRLRSSEVSAGGELGLRGEKLLKNAALRLELRGTLETFPLGEVRTDAKGVFQARLALPAEARAGSYTVVAVAPDGDVAARAELTVSAAPPTTPAGVAEHEGHGAMQPGALAPNSPHPTADMMKVPVSTTGLELAAIAGIVGVSLAGGLLLLRGARAPSR